MAIGVRLVLPCIVMSSGFHSSDWARAFFPGFSERCSLSSSYSFLFAQKIPARQTKARFNVTEIDREQIGFLRGRRGERKGGRKGEGEKRRRKWKWKWKRKRKKRNKISSNRKCRKRIRKPKYTKEEKKKIPNLVPPPFSSPFMTSTSSSLFSLHY